MGTVSSGLVRLACPLVVLAACGSGEDSAQPKPKPKACPRLGEPKLEIGGGSWEVGWEPLEAGDTIELQPGRIGKRPYELAQRVGGIDTAADELEEVEVLAWANDWQVGGYFGRPRFEPSGGGAVETFEVPVVADVADEHLQHRAIDFVATALDRCGRTAEGSLVLESYLDKPSY